jgi:hydroxymethylpyrimidine/phosphomethylpyrimidine kinase
MINHLFPLLTLLTPNMPEAEYFMRLRLGDKTAANEKSVYTDADAELLGKELINAYSLPNILLKGGHIANTDGVRDRLLMRKLDGEIESLNFESQKIESTHTHGTGCALSSAIASGLASGKSLPEAVKDAKTFIASAIKRGTEYPIAEKNGPIYYF